MLDFGRNAVSAQSDEEDDADEESESCSNYDERRLLLLLFKIEVCIQDKRATIVKVLGKVIAMSCN